MGLIAKESGGSKIPLVEAGSYPAVCYAVIDLGEQYSQKYDKSNRKVLIMWEIPSETVVIDGEELPRALSASYTMSLGEKASLRATLEGWRGKAFTAEELKGFNLAALLGKGCMLGVTHASKSDGGIYAKINSVSKLPKGFEVGESTNPKVLFDLDEPGALTRMGALPEWIQTRIQESETYKQLATAPDGSAPPASSFAVIGDDDDLPF